MLSARESAFVASFLASGNATASAIAANFSHKGASVAGNRMLRNARVKKALQDRQAADAARLSVQREDVLNGLLQAAEMAKLQCDPAGMVAAWKQVGHLMGFYSPERIKVDMSVQGQTVVNQLERLSDAELLALMASGGGAAAH